jgi:copper(I)-binding protein
MKRIGVAGATLLALVVVLSGCSAGQTASPDPLFGHTRIGLDSVDGRVGDLRLLSVSIASPGARGSTHLAGNSAALLLTVANDGTDEDVLTGATAEGAEHVVLRHGDAAAHQEWEVSVPVAGVAVLRDVAGRHLELAGLRETLRSGFSVPVVLRFRSAGAVTLQVPVRTYTDVPVDRVPQPLSVTNR